MPTALGILDIARTLCGRRSVLPIRDLVRTATRQLCCSLLLRRAQLTVRSSSDATPSQPPGTARQTNGQAGALLVQQRAASRRIWGILGQPHATRAPISTCGRRRGSAMRILRCSQGALPRARFPRSRIGRTPPQDLDLSCEASSAVFIDRGLCRRFGPRFWICFVFGIFDSSVAASRARLSSTCTVRDLIGAVGDSKISCPPSDGSGSSRTRSTVQPADSSADV